MSLLRRSIVAALACAMALAVAAVPVAAEPWPVRSLPIFARTAIGITKTARSPNCPNGPAFGRT